MGLWNRVPGAALLVLLLGTVPVLADQGEAEEHLPLAPADEQPAHSVPEENNSGFRPYIEPQLDLGLCDS